MDIKRLKDVANLIRGVSYNPQDLHDELDDKSIKLLKNNNINDDGTILLKSVVYVDRTKVSSDQLLKKGDIIVCASGSDSLVGKAALFDLDGEYTFGAFCKVVRPISINYHYLGMYFKSINYRLTISSLAQGAIMKNLRNEHLLNLIIDCPDDNEQECIQAILNNIFSIIQMRKKQLGILDDLVKARFVEMFGTYPANEKGWDTGTIRDLVMEVRYGSSRKAADGNSGQFPYLRMNNITYGGELDLTDTKTIDIPDEEIDKCTVRRGDLLFNRTNSKELVGKTCVYNRDEMMVLAGFVVRVRLNDKALPEFVSAFLNTDFSKQMLLNMCKAAIGQANINAQELQSIGIYIQT